MGTPPHEGHSSKSRLTSTPTCFGSLCRVLRSYFSLFFFFGLFRDALAAYGGSQARGPLAATAAGLHHGHSNVGSELCL